MKNLNVQESVGQKISLQFDSSNFSNDVVNRKLGESRVSSLGAVGSLGASANRFTTPENVDYNMYPQKMKPQR